LICLCDTVTQITCRIQAARVRAILDEALVKKLRLSDADKQNLRMAAPWAEKSFDSLMLKYGDKIGLGIFAVLYWSVLSDKLMLIKDAPKRPKEEEKKPEEKKEGGAA
jgi:hypothetical protein